MTIITNNNLLRSFYTAFINRMLFLLRAPSNLAYSPKRLIEPHLPAPKESCGPAGREKQSRFDSTLPRTSTLPANYLPRILSKLSGSPTRHRVFNTVHHHRLAGCSTESSQPSTGAKRRFWERKSSAGNCYRIKIGLNF